MQEVYRHFGVNTLLPAGFGYDAENDLFIGYKREKRNSKALPQNDFEKSI